MAHISRKQLKELVNSMSGIVTLTALASRVEHEFKIEGTCARNLVEQFLEREAAAGEMASYHIMKPKCRNESFLASPSYMCRKLNSEEFSEGIEPNIIINIMGSANEVAEEALWARAEIETNQNISVTDSSKNEFKLASADKVEVTEEDIELEDVAYTEAATEEDQTSEDVEVYSEETTEEFQNSDDEVVYAEAATEDELSDEEMAYEVAATEDKQARADAGIECNQTTSEDDVEHEVTTRDDEEEPAEAKLCTHHRNMIGSRGRGSRKPNARNRAGKPKKRQRGVVKPIRGGLRINKGRRRS